MAFQHASSMLYLDPAGTPVILSFCHPVIVLGVPKNKPKVARNRPMTGNDRRAPLCHAARVQKIEKIAASFAPKVPMTGRARSVMAPSVPKNRGNDAEIRPRRPMTG